MGTLHGFVGLLFGVQIITHAMGYSSGGFFQSCASLLPQHSFNGRDFLPQSGTPPFEVNVIAGEGESIIVSLGSSSSAARPFTGFMVDVRKSEKDPAKGSFVEFGPGSKGLKCNRVQDSAVTQNSNVPKTFVQVKWQAQENGSSSFFLRATFVERIDIFWSPVKVPIQTPPTTQPSTTTLTSEQSTEQPSTEQPTTEQPTTELPSTDQPSTDQPTTEQTITEQTSTEQPSTEQTSTTLGTQSTTVLATQPSTIQLTTTLRTNPSSTQGSTSAPEGPSSTPDLGQPSDNRLLRLYQAVAPLICSITINGHGFLQPPTMKIIRILQWTLSLAAETISLTLLCLWDSGYVPPIALVSVVLFTSLLGYSLLIASLVIGPSHELKIIHDGVTKVVTILHEVLLLAAIFLCLWKIEESDVWKICCDSLLLLGVMAGYTAWRFLFILIFLLIICVFKKTTAQRNRRGNDYTDSRCRKSTVIIFNLGNIGFAIALIVLMFPCF